MFNWPGPEDYMLEILEDYMLEIFVVLSQKLCDIVCSSTIVVRQITVTKLLAEYFC